MSTKSLVLALIPKVSGILSMTFSSFVVYDVFQKMRRKESNVYHRLILGMSISDLSSSSWMALSTWPVPSGQGVTWAVGNQATCNLQGFFVHMSIASPIYSVALAILYLLVVRYRWREKKLLKIEPVLHIAAFLCAVGTAVAALLLDLFSYQNPWCAIAFQPDGTGDRNQILRLLLYYGPLWGAFILVSCNTIVVELAAKQTTDNLRLSSSRSTNVEVKPSTPQPTDGEDPDESWVDSEDDVEVAKPVEEGDACNPPTKNAGVSNEPDSNASYNANVDSDSVQVVIPRKSARHCERRHFIRRSRLVRWTRKVSAQCTRYAVAYYFSWVPITIVEACRLVGTEPAYGIVVLAAIVTPLRGVPMAVVYFLPKREHEKSRLGSVLRMICGATRHKGDNGSLSDGYDSPNASIIMDCGFSHGSGLVSDDPGQVEDRRKDPYECEVVREASNEDVENLLDVEQAAAEGYSSSHNSVVAVGSTVDDTSSITYSEVSEIVPVERRVRSTGRKTVRQTSSITIELDTFEEGDEFNIPRMDSVSPVKSKEGSLASSQHDHRPLVPLRYSSDQRRPIPTNEYIDSKVYESPLRESGRGLTPKVYDNLPRLPRHQISTISDGDSLEDDDDNESEHADGEATDRAELPSTRPVSNNQAPEFEKAVPETPSEVKDETGVMRGTSAMADGEYHSAGHIDDLSKVDNGTKIEESSKHNLPDRLPKDPSPVQSGGSDQDQMAKDAATTAQPQQEELVDLESEQGAGMDQPIHRESMEASSPQHLHSRNGTTQTGIGEEHGDSAPPTKGTILPPIRPKMDLPMRRISLDRLPKLPSRLVSDGSCSGNESKSASRDSRPVFESSVVKTISEASVARRKSDEMLPAPPARNPSESSAAAAKPEVGSDRPNSPRVDTAVGDSNEFGPSMPRRSQTEIGRSEEQWNSEPFGILGLEPIQPPDGHIAKSKRQSWNGHSSVDIWSSIPKQHDQELSPLVSLSSIADLAGSVHGSTHHPKQQRRRNSVDYIPIVPQRFGNLTSFAASEHGDSFDLLVPLASSPPCQRRPSIDIIPSVPTRKRADVEGVAEYPSRNMGKLQRRKSSDLLPTIPQRHDGKPVASAQALQQGGATQRGSLDAIPRKPSRGEYDTTEPDLECESTKHDRSTMDGEMADHSDSLSSLGLLVRRGSGDLLPNLPSRILSEFSFAELAELEADYADSEPDPAFVPPPVPVMEKLPEVNEPARRRSSDMVPTVPRRAASDSSVEVNLHELDEYVRAADNDEVPGSIKADSSPAPPVQRVRQVSTLLPPLR